MILRHFKSDDADILQQLQYINMPIEEIKTLICDWNKFKFQGKYFEMFAIVSDDKIVGTISLYQHSSSVISIGPEVFSPFRKQGLGKQAMRIALDIAKSKGYKIVIQQVRSDNTSSIALHKSLGFETDDCSYTNSKGNEVTLYFKALF